MEQNNIDTAIAALNRQEQLPQSIDVIVREDFVEKLPQILSNLESVKAWAIACTEQDRSLMLVSDEDFEQAKKRCATINNVIKTINGKKIDVKKAYIKPYELFEQKAKEVIEILSTAKDHLWLQVCDAEEKAKNAKLEELRAHWESLGEKCEYRSFGQIFDKKWLNKGCKVETAFAEMDKIYQSIETDIGAIKGLNSEFTVSLYEYYKDGHSVSEVIAYNNRLAAQKQAVEQQKQANKGIPQTKEEKAKIAKESADKDETEEVQEITFKVWGTSEQFAKLKKFLNENGMRYGKA